VSTKWQSDLKSIVLCKEHIVLVEELNGQCMETWVF
jgi:hypothetical protein